MSEIRLVAVDLDGTLLNSRGELPPGVFPAIRALAAHGVCFAAASGRQYDNLRTLFAEVAAETVFIAENGAMVFERDRNLFDSVLEPELCQELLTAARELPRVFPVLCGLESAYMSSDDPEFLHNARKYYTRCETVSPLTAALARDRICKVAFYDGVHAEENSYPRLRRFADRFRVSLSGYNWLDFMNPGVSKGAALARLQCRLGVTPEQSMAFGDYLNDLELLRQCRYSFAMANAHPELKAAARFEAPGNDQDGVMRVLRTCFPFLEAAR